MAEYPILAPTLAALNATKNDPDGSEAASKLSNSVRQTRNWIYDYLNQYFDANGLKSGAFASGGSLPTQYIRGTTAAGVAREIAQGSIRAADIADGEVTTSKLRDRGVEESKIAAKTITSTVIKDKGVSGESIADGVLVSRHFSTQSFNGNLIVDNSITTGKYQANSIRGADMAEKTVEGDRMMTGMTGEVLVGGNTVNGVNNSFASKKLSGAITIDANGVTSFAAGLGTGVAHIVEKTTYGTGGGSSVANAWNMRGLKTPWFIDYDPSSLVRINGSNIQIVKAGLYLIFVSLPCYMGNHRGRVTCKPDGNATDTLTSYLSSELSWGSHGTTVAQGSQTRSQGVIYVQFVNCNGPIYPYLFCEHWITNAVASYGLGFPVYAVGADTLPEYYAELTLVKLT